MKLPITLSLAALSLPMMSAAFAPTIAPTAPTIADRPLFEGKWLEGTIDGWLVEEDGAVLVRLLPKQAKSAVWLRTAPNQSSTTQFELLTLHAIMHLEAKPGTVHVRGEASTEDDGKDPEHAMRLLSIGRK